MFLTLFCTSDCGRGSALDPGQEYGEVQNTA